MYNDDTIVCDKVFVCAYLKKKQDSRDHFILFLHPLRIIHYRYCIIFILQFQCCQLEFICGRQIYRTGIWIQFVDFFIMHTSNILQYGQSREWNRNKGGGGLAQSCKPEPSSLAGARAGNNRRLWLQLSSFYHFYLRSFLFSLKN